MKEIVLVVGLGEVGETLFTLLRESGEFETYGFDVDERKTQALVGKVNLPKNVDVMHVCYPCRDQEFFVETTLEYIRMFQPKLTIIESTVNPGTTQKISELSRLPLVHSPLRGMHKTLEKMKEDVLFWTKYVGGTTGKSAEAAKDHFEKLGLKVKVLRSPAETELAKLFETTYRAWMIACFQEMHRISKHFKADFDEVVDMMEDIHRVDRNKPLHYPDVISGHCLIPNTKLLLRVYDSEFLKLILESNEKRKEEVKEKDILEDIEKIKKRTLVLEKETGTRNV
jgi:UDP-N-acetyl-D-mannosaminuronate dehydrogenase